MGMAYEVNCGTNHRRLSTHALNQVQNHRLLRMNHHAIPAQYVEITASGKSNTAATSRRSTNHYLSATKNDSLTSHRERNNFAVNTETLSDIFLAQRHQHLLFMFHSVQFVLSMPMTQEMFRFVGRFSGVWRVVLSCARISMYRVHLFYHAMHRMHSVR